MHFLFWAMRCGVLLAVVVGGDRLVSAQDAEPSSAAAVVRASDPEPAANSHQAEAKRTEKFPRAPGGERPKLPTPREVLSTLGLGDEFFTSFTDGELLEPAEREKLLTLLSRMPEISKPVLQAAQQRANTIRRLRLDPAAHRGDIYHLRVGRVTRVEREELPDELKARLGISHFFRCQAVLVGEYCEIYTLAVPEAWKRNRTIDEECSAWAMFVKVLPKPVAKRSLEDSEADDEESTERPNVVEDDSAPLLFVAERIAWHPTTLLGFLGVDHGLFEQVRDGTPLTEREVFRQMLAAASRMTDDYLRGQVARWVKDEHTSLERLVRNRDLPAKLRADARRGWDRIQEGASDVIPLLNDPASQRGRFVVLQGEAVRAVEVQLDDPDAMQRFGIDHYYEIDLLTPDSQDQPLVCCVVRLPQELPLGSEIHEQVQVAGFFLKSAELADRRTYPAVGGHSADALAKATTQFAPLLVAPTIEVLTPVRFQTPTQSLQLAAGLLVVFVGFGLAMWYMRGSDRRAAKLLGGANSTG